MEISPSPCRILKRLQTRCMLQQVFRADFYTHFTDSIRSELHSFSSSFCLFLNVCSTCWRWNVKNSYIFCLRDHASDTHERKSEAREYTLPFHPRQASHPAPGGSPGTFSQSLQQECKFLVCSAVPWEQDRQSPMLFRNTRTLCHAYTSTNTAVHLHWQQEGDGSASPSQLLVQTTDKLVSRGYCGEMVQLLQSCPLATHCEQQQQLSLSSILPIPCFLNSFTTPRLRM